MIFLVIAVIVVLLIMFTLVFLILVKPQVFDKNTDKNGNVVSAETRQYKDGSGETVGDAKAFLPFRGFEDYAMDLGNHNYRAVIECSSVNFTLMSAMEQQMVESSYMMFLNSLSFPIEIYIQTREFDKAAVMDNLHKNINSSTKRFPFLADYAEDYENAMQYLTDYINNSKIKKKYLIVPFSPSDLSDVSALTSYEIRSFALEQLYNRAEVVCSGIMGCGIEAKILPKEEIAECLYSYYHRNTFRIASDILGGEFTTLAVNGEKEINDTDRRRLDEILTSAQNRIRFESERYGVTAEETLFYHYIFDALEAFKQDNKPGDMLSMLKRSRENAKENGYQNPYIGYLSGSDEEPKPDKSVPDTTRLTPRFPYVHPDVESDVMGEFEDSGQEEPEIKKAEKEKPKIKIPDDEAPAFSGTEDASKKEEPERNASAVSGTEAPQQEGPESVISVFTDTEDDSPQEEEPENKTAPVFKGLEEEAGDWIET